MNRILSWVALFSLLCLGSCQSPTDNGPAIDVTISGGGLHAVNTFVTFTANEVYSGTGTITYKWKINSYVVPNPKKTLNYKSDAISTDTIYLEVTDGKLSGRTSTTVTWN